MGSLATAVKARFAGFELDFRSGELARNGRRVRLQEQPFRVLRLLLDHAGEVVPREELQRQLWPQETFVDFDHGLNKAIGKLREALDNPDADSSLIETLPRRGYRLTSQVEWITEANGNGAIPEPTPGPQPSPFVARWRRNAAIALVACAAAGVLFYLWVTPRIARLIRLYQVQRLTEVPVTSLPGFVASPTFSPDGSQIAFAWDGENNGAGFDLYVKAIGAEEPLRITHHPSVRLSAAWSPDGSSIAISRVAGEEDSGIYLVPPTGGPERKLISRSRTVWFGNELSWSPDGKYLAFIEHPADATSDLALGLYLLSLETLKPTLVKTGCVVTQSPAFSPQGNQLAWICASPAGSLSLQLLRLSDGLITQLLERPDEIMGIAWSADGRRIAFGTGDLWEAPVARPDDVLKLPVGGNASDLAASPSGHRLAFVRAENNINIWRLDLKASPPKASKLVVSSSIQEPHSISPDGKRIAFESDRTGSNEIWTCDADGSNALQLTSFGTPGAGDASWSPDGRLIAFDALTSGESNIYVVDANGGTPRKIGIDNAHGNTLPSWSRDGNWIYFNNGDGAGKPSVWKVPSQGGHALQVAQNPATYALESPDGQHVYFVRNKKLWRAKTDGSSPEEVHGMPELKFAGDEWFPSGSGIYFMSHSGDKAAIEFFDLNSEKVSRVYSLEKSPPTWIGGMPVSSDGKWLLFPQRDRHSGDLVMIENWK